MFIIKTIFHAVCNVFRRPYVLKKLGILAAATISFYVASQILAHHLDGTGLGQKAAAFLVQWIWVPLAVLFLCLRYGDIRIQKEFKDFINENNFISSGGLCPKFKWKKALNDYVSVIRFKSYIPLDRWREEKSEIEMHFDNKIIKIERPSPQKVREVDVYIMEQELPEIIEWKDEYMPEGGKFAIGQSLFGQEVWDFNVLDHGLIAGSSHAGKSNMIRCIIRQAILKKFNVSVFDGKAGGDYSDMKNELSKYGDLEEGYGRFVKSDPKDVRDLLVSLVVEVRGRLEEFEKAGVSNLDEYNALRRDTRLPWLVVIDEAAEFLDVKAKDKAEKELYSEIESDLRLLTRISRAAGVHILIGFIRPDSDVISGQIKNNLLWRACGYFVDAPASRIVLDNDAATTLPPKIKGRFIVNGNETQAYYLPLPKAYDKSENSK